MINFSFANVAKLVLGFFLSISQLAGKPVTPHTSTLSLGDRVNDMTLSKGVDHARSLWSFCFNTPEGEGSYMLDCRVPAKDSLRMGNIPLSANEVMPNPAWSELVWELSIDGQAVNLEPFETCDYVMPGMSEILASPVLDTFKRDTGWNIVLTDLQPGQHTLWLVAQNKTGDDSYTWFVNLEIEK